MEPWEADWGVVFCLFTTCLIFGDILVNCCLSLTKKMRIWVKIVKKDDDLGFVFVGFLNLFLYFDLGISNNMK